MRLLEHFFAHLRGIFWIISFLERKLTFFTSGFGSLSDLLPIFLLSPAYFNGQLSMGELLQVRHALGEVTNGFSWFVGSYFSLAEWSAVSTRLDEIDKLAAKRQEMIANAPERLDGLEVRDLSLVADEKVLLENANFRVKSGQWACMTGPEGAGKSTIMRAMKGIWPLQAGRVGPPTEGTTMFIPAAKASGLRQGTLTDAVAYPLHVGKMKAPAAPRAETARPSVAASTGETEDVPLLASSGPDQEKTEHEEIVRALKEVGLSYLWPDGEEEPSNDWGRTLSSGELSRLLLARALVIKPDVLCMDEPVAHCAEGEPSKKLMRTIKDGLPSHTSVLTITHDVNDLLEFHDSQIIIDPKAKNLTTKG